MSTKRKHAIEEICKNHMTHQFFKASGHQGRKFPTYPMISSLLPIRADLKYDVTPTRKFKN